MAGRLLLIGESNNDLTELTITFEALGLTVEVAPDGLAGLEKGREFQPDLVVTEILTNRLSGFELASRIGSGAAGFVAPVIFYTEFYRDEKARREVLAKYGAIQYFVRPFQKETLKKSVTAHFQDFLSKLPLVPIAESPEPAVSPEVDAALPQLSRAVAAAEQKPTNPLPGRSVQPGKPGGISGEVPSRFRAFSPATQASTGDVPGLELEAVGAVADETENTPVAVPVMPLPRVETTEASTTSSIPLQRGLLLPVEEPTWIGRLMRSTAFRIAAVVIVAALALYLVHDRFQSGNQEVSTQPELPIATEPLPPTRATVEPSATVDSPPATVPTSPPPVQDSLEVAPAQTGTEPTKPDLFSTADMSTRPDALKKTESMDSRAAVRAGSPTLSIQDVTGSGRGPVLRKMKPIQLSQDMLSSLGTKAVVVRVAVDHSGKVTEVVPVTPVALPAGALATIQQWEFSRSRRKGAGESFKYFSLKVQSPR